MKRIIIAILILAMLLSMAACASAPATPVATPQPTTASPEPTAEPTAEPTTEPTASPVETAAPTEEVSGGGEKDYGQIGSDLMKAEAIGAARLGMSEGELSEALGEPDSKSGIEPWGADGKNHCDWGYESLGLTINLAGGADADEEMFIFSITATAPCDLATKNGVKIGDTKGAVLAAYGDAVEDQTEEGTKERIVAGTAFGGLIFGMEEGKVVSIFLGAAAE